MISRLIGSPSPVPGGRSVIVSSPWRNLSKITSWSSGSMPGPLSRTSTRSRVRPSTLSSTTTRPRLGVAELRRVREQVEQHLLDAVAVGGHRAAPPRGSRTASSTSRSAKQLCGRRGRLLDQLAEVHLGDLPLGPPGLDLREVEHLVDQPREPLDLLDHDAQEALALRRPAAPGCRAGSPRRRASRSAACAARASPWRRSRPSGGRAPAAAGWLPRSSAVAASSSRDLRSSSWL